MLTTYIVWINMCIDHIKIQDNIIKIELLILIFNAKQNRSNFLRQNLVRYKIYWKRKRWRKRKGQKDRKRQRDGHTDGHKEGRKETERQRKQKRQTDKQ